MYHAVLLLAINLAGRNRIRMADLREALVRRGFDQPRTYLQSGNVVVETDLTSSELEQLVSDAIRAEFGLDIGALALGAPELASIVTANPYRAQAEADPTRVHAMFVSPMPSEAALAAIEADRHLPEEFSAGPGVIYLHLPNGMGRARLPEALTRALSEATVTVRNWRTVTALAGMMEG